MIKQICFALFALTLSAAHASSNFNSGANLFNQAVDDLPRLQSVLGELNRSGEDCYRQIKAVRANYALAVGTAGSADHCRRFIQDWKSAQQRGDSLLMVALLAPLPGDNILTADQHGQRALLIAAFFQLREHHRRAWEWFFIGG